MSRKPKQTILISNDDGVEAPGLQALKEALQPLGHIVTVAPDRPRSSCGHSVTLHKPLRIKKTVDENGDINHACTGTPADCVALGIWVVCKKPPDLVVAGINLGANMGSDVHYSGTIAAAREAALQGIRSFAISIVAERDPSFKSAQIIARGISEHLLSESWPSETLINVNVPNIMPDQLQGVAISRCGFKRYVGGPEEHLDPSGQSYYWRGAEKPTMKPGSGTDVSAVRARKVSITPLNLHAVTSNDTEWLRPLETNLLK